MPRLAWVTDPHLNFVAAAGVADFLGELAATPADALLVSGDIDEAPDVARSLAGMAAAVERPVLFVLGNHDYYRGTIAAVRAEVRALCETVPHLHWLPSAGVVPVSADTCVVGHDGWGDGRLGDYWGSPIALNDWRLIGEFAGLGRAARLALLNALGDEAAAHFKSVLPDALSRFRHVVVVTHVPPFRDACLYQGRVSGDEWLPHFACRAVGVALAEAMAARPDRRMTVVCGHTHGAGEADVLPNLRVLAGGAEYGKPAVQRVLDVG
jgi:Icc protein